jgi:predicted acylesterase/phospholipase RssA
MDCVYSSWTTSSPDGFREMDLIALRRLVPLLALAVKCASLARIARTLVDVYLGHDAAERVLSGRELFGRSLDTVQATITRLKPAAQPPDLLITIPRNACAFYEFHRAEELIEIGRRRTREALKRWHPPPPRRAG